MPTFFYFLFVTWLLRKSPERCLALLPLLLLLLPLLLPLLLLPLLLLLLLFLQLLLLLLLHCSCIGKVAAVRDDSCGSLTNPRVQCRKQPRPTL